MLKLTEKQLLIVFTFLGVLQNLCLNFVETTKRVLTSGCVLQQSFVSVFAQLLFITI